MGVTRATAATTTESASSRTLPTTTTLRTAGGMVSFTRPCLMTAPVPACRATTITFSRATCAASAEPKIQRDQNGDVFGLDWRHFDSIRAVLWAMTTDKNPHL